ncbi:hypothetical protein I4U23_031446 [Adineta vaga]|nr:hypothetical protein I4U23_031446 [Adineta vaga]
MVWEQIDWSISEITIAFGSLLILGFVLLQMKHWFSFRSTNSWYRSMPFNIRETFSFGALRKATFLGRSFSKKHGPIYRLHSMFETVVILASSDLAAEFYKHSRTLQRSPEVSLLGQVSETVMGKCMAALHGQQWQSCRNAFKTTFLTKAVQDCFQMIQGEITKWQAEYVTNGAVLDVQRSKIDELPLKILVHVVYGDDITEDEVEQVLLFGREHGVIMDASMNILENLPGYKSLPWSLNARSKKFRAEWQRFNMVKLKKALNPSAQERTDVFSIAAKYFMQQEDDFDSKIAMFFDTIDEILLLNIDVTYVALMNMLVFVASNESVMATLRDEIKNSASFNSKIEYDTLSKLPYLDAVFKESVRLRPPLSLSFPERTTEPMILGGYQIPAGTAVMIDAASINHDGQVWNHPDDFDPNRFLDIQESGIEFQYFKYGLNRNRRCLGFRYAEAIVKQVSWDILSLAKIDIADDEDPTQAMKKWSSCVRDKGLPFFTPYSNFPRLKMTFDFGDVTSLKLAPVFRIDDGKSAPCFIAGERALREKGSVLFGMSFGNSYYSEDVIKSVIPFLGSRFSRIFIDVPDEWTKHTYTALGYSGSDAKKKLRNLTTRLRKRCQLGVDIATQSGIAPRENFIFVDWGTHVETSNIYQNALTKIKKAYQQNEAFRTDCNATTEEVLRSQGRSHGWDNKSSAELATAIEIAVTYVLMELAEAVAFGDIASRVTNGGHAPNTPAAMVYHRRWLVLEKFLNCEYENEICKQLVNKLALNFGFLIFEARPVKCSSHEEFAGDETEKGTATVIN